MSEDNNFEVSEKFKEFENQGISAPQVLTFLDNISTMLMAISSDIQKAVMNIEESNPNKEEKKEEAL
tara:strand:- start:7768 stop:7968 length:201 start_codon:yes stop_codon:yes gene_type:complete